jgi:hypothetical protein
MDHLTSPKLAPGVHCLSLRHKGMYVMAAEDPDELSFYDTYDSTWYWCAETATGFGPDGVPVNPASCQGQRGCCKH